MAMANSDKRLGKFAQMAAGQVDSDLVNEVNNKYVSGAPRSGGEGQQVEGLFRPISGKSNSNRYNSQGEDL